MFCIKAQPTLDGRRGHEQHQNGAHALPDKRTGHPAGLLGPETIAAQAGGRVDAGTRKVILVDDLVATGGTIAGAAASAAGSRSPKDPWAERPPGGA